MQIVVIGSGLMGPAAAYNALGDPEVSQVLVCDVSPAQLEVCKRKLGPLPGAEKLSFRQLDLRDQTAAAQMMAGSAAVIGALPHEFNILGMRAALQARVPLVDLNWPEPADVPALQREAEAAGTLIMPGCGLEPGLTEIVARQLAEQLDRVDEVHIRCGGIPAAPTPPLGYKIVFGGRQLPLRESDTQYVRDGQLQTVPRYSGVESLTFGGVGQVEAWHEGFMPWLLELPALRDLRLGTQKTIRWPGYAQKVTLLKEMGLFSQTPIEVEGARIAPKKFFDTLLYPRVRLEEGEHDITLFRVEVSGAKAGRPQRYTVELIDRYDPALNFTSMARTTAFTAAIMARLIARGELKAGGFVTPEKLITGRLFDRLLAELAAQNVCFELTEQSSRELA